MVIYFLHIPSSIPIALPFFAISAAGALRTPASSRRGETPQAMPETPGRTNTRTLRGARAGHTHLKSFALRSMMALSLASPHASV